MYQGLDDTDPHEHLGVNQDEQEHKPFLRLVDPSRLQDPMASNSWYHDYNAEYM